jgi:hypothetical protein
MMRQDTVSIELGPLASPAFPQIEPGNQAHRYLLVILHIDNSVLPLPSRDTPLKHDVNSAVGSPFHLRQVEMCHDQPEQTGATPDVTALAAKVSALETVLAIVTAKLGGRRVLLSG